MGDTRHQVGSPPTSSMCHLLRQSEFPLMLHLAKRQSPFGNGEWGLTYANKARQAQVFLAGSAMKGLSRIWGVQMGYKTYYPFIYHVYYDFM